MSTPRTIINEKLINFWLQETRSGAYPFHKRKEHFLTKGEEKVYNKKGLYQLKKTTKVNESERRKKGEWISLNTTTIKPECFSQANQYSIYAAERTCFYLGKHQPSYRVWQETDYRKDSSGEQVAVYNLATRKVENSEPFYIYFRSSIYPNIRGPIKSIEADDFFYSGYIFVEGLGSSSFEQWYGEENDAHFDNILVKDKRFALPIDFDQWTSSLTAKFHIFPVKEIHPVYESFLYKKENIWLEDIKIIPHTESRLKVDGKENNYMGTMHADDYETLPIIRHQIHTNWQFDSLAAIPYAKELVHEPFFANEKHFLALNHIITPMIPIFLAKYHLSGTDQADLITWEEERREKLINICKTSPTFLAYMKDHYILALKTILYRAYEFFEDRKHYRPKSGAAFEKLWTVLSTDIINEATAVLPSLNIPSLTESEQLALLQFAANIRSKEAGMKVEQFYLQQGRQYEAESCIRQWSPLEKAYSSRLSLTPAVAIAPSVDEEKTFYLKGP